MQNLDALGDFESITDRAAERLVHTGMAATPDGLENFRAANA